MEDLDCEKLHEMIEDWFGVIPCSEEGMKKISRELSEYVNIQIYIKQEIEGFVPQYTTGADDPNEMWPAKDVKECFEEIRFIMKYGMAMGRVGKIPVDWETNPESDASIQARVDTMWESDEEEEE